MWLDNSLIDYLIGLSYVHFLHFPSHSTCITLSSIVCDFIAQEGGVQTKKAFLSGGFQKSDPSGEFIRLKKMEREYKFWEKKQSILDKQAGERGYLSKYEKSPS